MTSMRRVGDDRIDDLFELQAFAQEMVRPQVPATPAIGGIIEVGQHDDDHFRIVGLEHLEQRDAALIGQVNVQGHRVGMQLLDGGHGLMAAAGLAGDADLRRLGQQRGDTFTDLGGIVDDQHVFHEPAPFF
ncbi:hypothetical protein DESC_610360 [Desulfosarcina cetonica]|nr:hypothetical protein DESC_610360 [Desulfosarcina cetonica]